jgi:hypothetical protein
VVPAPSSFDRALDELGAKTTGVINPPGRDGFANRYTIEGIELQTGGTPVASIDDRLNRIAEGDVDWVTAKVAMGLVDGVALHGEELVGKWKRRAAYPDALRRREVEANIRIFPVWRADAQLAARDAELFRRQMLVEGAFRVAAVLSALNRAYFSTFQFKRAREHFAPMALKPERVSERLDTVANAPPSVAAEELRQLVEETRDIVRAEMPEVDVDAPWQPLRDGR